MRNSGRRWHRRIPRNSGRFRAATFSGGLMQRTIARADRTARSGHDAVGMRAGPAKPERGGAEIQSGPLSGQDRRGQRRGHELVGASAGAVQLYKVDDGTGELTVVSQGGRTPSKGSTCPGQGARQRSGNLRRPVARPAPRTARPLVQAVRRRTAYRPTAVMSSFGGVSPRHACTAAKIASTTFAAG